MYNQKHVLWDRLNPGAQLLRDHTKLGSEGSLGDPGGFISIATQSKIATS